MVDYYSCKMSGSDEEFEPQIQTGMSKAELRRSNKPIMEKKRRARINQCLDELKSLILEAMKKDPTRHSKLEKADILEMTVKHLQQIQRQQLSTAVATDPAVLTKFRSGFSECANEVSRYVNHLENVDPSVKQRLVSHLNNCVSNLQQVSPFYNHYVPYMPERLYPEVKVGFQADVQTSGDENNNNNNNTSANTGARIQIPSNVQLIPSRLPTGELALLVPPSAGISANFPFFPPAGSDAGSRIGTPSAFTAVQRTHSPLLSPSTSTSSFEENHHSEQYQASLSPPPQMRFKLPEQSPASSSSTRSYSSPETQKPQISSSSDRNSPTTTPTPIMMMQFSDSSRASVEVNSSTGLKRDSDSADAIYAPASLPRQPLSVITDKYNRTLTIPKRENGLKRHNSDGLLAVAAEKKPRYEPSVSPVVSASTSSFSPSSSPSIRIKEEFPNSSDELGSKTAASPAPGVISSEPPTTPNGDMWRPW